MCLKFNQMVRKYHPRDKRAEIEEIQNNEIKRLERKCKRLQGYLDDISNHSIPKQTFTSPEHQTNMIKAEIDKREKDLEKILDIYPVIGEELSAENAWQKVHDAVREARYHLEES